jgi:murein DD-endopeptidase MepM/ murein hydrolase activator NlpD
MMRRSIRSGSALLPAFAILLVLAGCTRTLPPAPVVEGVRAMGSPSPGGSVPSRPTLRTVVVGKGETLYSIARRHRIPLRELIQVNRIRAPYAVAPGRRLKLPVPRRHLVRSGDTVYGISRRYRVDMTALARINGLGPPYRITPGQKLRLPGAGGGARTTRVANRTTARPPLPGRKPVRVPGKRSEPAPPRTSAKFAWPLRGPILVKFGPRGGGVHNDGINIAARAGTPVRATEDGIVAYAGNELRGFGNLLLIRHGGNWMSAYAHSRDILVRRGDRVKRGQTIARVGSTGNVTRPQLHFELRKGDEAVNPARHLTRAALGRRATSVASRAGRRGPE